MNKILSMNGFYVILFILSILAISFGSVGSGFFNNYNITVYLSYFLIIILLISKGEALKNLKTALSLKICIMFLVFFISCVIAEMNSAFDVWYRYFSILVCVLYGSVFYYLCESKKINIDIFYKALSGFGVLHVLFLIVFAFNLNDPLSHDWAKHLPFFNNIRNFTDYLVVCFLCSFYLFFKNTKDYKYFVFCTFILSCLFWSGSRSSILAGFCSLLFIIYYFKERLINFLYLSVMVFSSTLISICFAVNAPGFGLYSSLYRSVGGSLNKISSSRLDVYKQVFDLICSRPFFGYGGEAVRNQGVMAGEMKLAQAHNFILQILIEFGLVGLILVFIVLFSILSRVDFKGINKENCIVYAVVLNIIISSMFNGGFYYTATLSIFCLFLSYLCYLNNNVDSINER